MPRRITIVCLFFAWFCANGRVLDVVQCFAWAKMFVAYAPAMPLSEAITETLDAEKPCPICAGISKARGKQDPSHASEISSFEKFVLAAAKQDEVILVKPAREKWDLVHSPSLVERKEAVPVPPPRAA